MILTTSIPSPEMQFLQLGPFRIYFYAICILVGVVLAAIWTGRRFGRRGGEPGAILDFTVWTLVLGIVGARLYHVLTHWGDYIGPGRNPLEIFAFWNGGIAIFGALIGGWIGALVASRITGIRFWSFADALVPGLLLAQAIGRLGNWFNHELFGGPTTLPWGLEIASTNPAFPIGLPDGTLFHPTFLYEALWNVLGIVVLLAIERKLRPRWGQFFGLYLIWYGIGRFWVESLRVDPSLLFLGLRTNVWAALLAVVLGIAIYVVQGRRHPGVEQSIYLPGRTNPANSLFEDTDDPDTHHHVIDRGENESAEVESSETDTPDPESSQAEKPEKESV